MHNTLTPRSHTDQPGRGKGRAVLECTDAVFAYGSKTVLSGVNATLYPGQALALIGPNGSGKSTLLKGIIGLIPTVSGSVTVLGGSPSSARSAIGYVPQSDELDPDFPVSLRQVVMMGRYRKMTPLVRATKHDRQAVDQALETVGLHDFGRKRFGELSGGQKQRALVARALASEPRLLLLDEPFNGLDQVNRDKLVETLQTLREQSVTVVASTHDLELARQVCDQTMLLAGKMIGFGPTDDVLCVELLTETYRDTTIELDEHTLSLPGHDHAAHIPGAHSHRVHAGDHPKSSGLDGND